MHLLLVKILKESLAHKVIVNSNNNNNNNTCSLEPMDISIPDEEEIEKMDNEEEEEPSLPSPHPIPPGMFPPGGRGLPPPVFPPPGAGGGLPPPVRMPHPPINVPQPGVGLPGFNVNEKTIIIFIIIIMFIFKQPQPVMSFGGAGHKLGGKDVPVQFINPQEVSKSVSESGKLLAMTGYVYIVWYNHFSIALAAAEKRAKMLKEIAETSRGIVWSYTSTLINISLSCLSLSSHLSLHFLFSS